MDTDYIFLRNNRFQIKICGHHFKLYLLASTAAAHSRAELYKIHMRRKGMMMSKRVQEQVELARFKRMFAERPPTVTFAEHENNINIAIIYYNRD